MRKVHQDIKIIRKKTKVYIFMKYLEDLGFYTFPFNIKKKTYRKKIDGFKMRNKSS
jgi:hypothetical protein